VDLGNSLEATSVVNLERRLEYRTAGTDWSFSGLLQNFQVLDGGVAPHAKLPQLLWGYHPFQKGNGLDLDVEAEYTNFTGSKTETNGSRLDFMTRASKQFSTEAAYIKPSLTLRHTEYQLDDVNDTSISRSIPSASLDTGLFFERNIHEGRYVQTLEPRLFYTYTPFREQSDIPVFDSSARSLNYSQLFAENRFTGKDRIGDANRLTASISTRIQSPDDGRELFRASIGQMYHFDERKVTLLDEAPLQGDRSELILETAGEINPRTRINTTAYWDSKENSVNAGEIRVNYKDDKKRILNVSYAQRKDNFESASLSFAVPVNQQWKAIGAWEHDLQNDRDLETVIGAEYENCCWKTRVASRNYLLPDNTTRDNAVFVELELKGLGNFGSGTRNLLQDRVYGYE
jgi:LPS-assembly protein